jgi:hypothetical protein
LLTLVNIREVRFTGGKSNESGVVSYTIYNLVQTHYRICLGLELIQEFMKENIQISNIYKRGASDAW